MFFTKEDRELYLTPAQRAILETSTDQTAISTIRELGLLKKRVEQGYKREIEEVEQRLGAALGYPRYCDDPEEFPDATASDGVCIGSATAGTLAAEAAALIRKLRNPRVASPAPDLQVLRVRMSEAVRGTTPKEFAAACGVSVTAVYNCLHGRQPTLRTLWRMAKHTGHSIEWFLDEGAER